MEQRRIENIERKQADTERTLDLHTGMLQELSKKSDTHTHMLIAERTDILLLQNHVATLQDDVSILKSDVSILKSDVSTLKTEMREVRADITAIKATQSDHGELLKEHGELLRGQGQKIDQIHDLIIALMQQKQPDKE